MQRTGDHAVKGEILAIIEVECELEATPALSDSLADLGVDSMSVICAIHALEDRFGIDIPLDVSLTEFRTVGDIVAEVERMVVERDGGQSRTPTRVR